MCIKKCKASLSNMEACQIWKFGNREVSNHFATLNFCSRISSVHELIYPIIAGKFSRRNLGQI